MPNNYTGTIAITTAGYDCKNWMTNESDISNIILSDFDHNYCRSLTNESLGSWCYTTDSDISWQYCSCSVPNTGKHFINDITSIYSNTFKFPGVPRQIGLMPLGTRVKIIQIKNTAILKDCMVTGGLRTMGLLIIGGAIDIQL